MARVVPVSRTSPGWIALRRRLTKPRRYAFDWGDLRTTKPLSGMYGMDRGTPIDRPLIERFLAQHASHIRGRVIEVGDPRYTNKFGTAVETSDILDIVQTTDHKPTVIADLDEELSVPASLFDCVIATQVLQFVRKPTTALENLGRALSPSGVLLLTVPCLSRSDPTPTGREGDRWRWTPAGLNALLEAALPGARADVVGLGNVLTCVGFLVGAVAEELDESELTFDDPEFPLIAAAKVSFG